MVDLAPERVPSHSQDSGEGMENPQWQVVVVMESWWWFRGFFAPGAEDNPMVRSGGAFGENEVTIATIGVTIALLVKNTR